MVWDGTMVGPGVQNLNIKPGLTLATTINGEFKTSISSPMPAALVVTSSPARAKA
jgi:hypothetical protein